MGDSGRDIQKRSFAFACEVINFCDSADDRRRTTEHLLLQLFDAGTSVAANLAEASAGQTKPDFIAKASVALKESREARLWLELIVATRHRLRTAALPLLDEARQLVSISDHDREERSIEAPSRRVPGLSEPSEHFMQLGHCALCITRSLSPTPFRVLH